MFDMMTALADDGWTLSVTPDAESPTAYKKRCTLYTIEDAINTYTAETPEDLMKQIEEDVERLMARTARLGRTLNYMNRVGK